MTDTPARPILPAVPLSIPLTLAAHQQAQLAYQQHTEPGKAKQVYLNVLAVDAVRTYLQWMGYAAAPPACDSGSAAVLQVLADMAELVLPGRGRLACRPVLPEEAVCRVPPESWAASLGYVAVGLDAELRQARLLGYGPAAKCEAVPLAQLLPLVTLLERLQVSGAASQAGVARKLVDLSQWLAGKVTSGWQAAEELLGPQPSTFSFRSLESSNLWAPIGSVVRGKLLELIMSSEGWQTDSRQVALLVGILSRDTLRSNIWVNLRPTGSARYLPENLEIRVLDAQGLAVMEAQTRQTDALQLNFSGMSNEQFAIEIELNGANLVEKFVI